MKPVLIMGIRGRDGGSAPIAVADDQCCDAVNVDFFEGGLMRRRPGAEAPSFTGTAFTNDINALLRFLPGTDETATQLFAFGVTVTEIQRLSASLAWQTVSAIDSPTAGTTQHITGTSLGGFLHVAMDTGVNRMHVWDGTSLRRAGLGLPAAPTLATLGGAGLTITRYYRVRYLEVSGSNVIRKSEAGPSASLSITDDSGIRVTKPSSLGEGETHWEVEYADADAGPWYVAGRIVLATTTFDDSDATVDTTNDLSAEEGANQFAPSFKYVVKGGGRLLLAGAWETVLGNGDFLPGANEVYWTPVDGASDIGDLERVPVSYRVSLDHAVNGLSEALNGIHYAFGYRGISALVPTGLPGDGAYQRITERLDIGSLRHHAIVSAQDEHGNAAIYFLSHLGPYRITSRGMQYLGHDIEDLWDSLDLDTAIIGPHGVYHADLHQVWWYLPVGATVPGTKIVFDTRLGRSDGDVVLGGWVQHTGNACVARASVMFASSIGSTMSHDLVPYVAINGTLTIWRTDTGTDDVGTDYQAYLDTKEYAPAGIGKNCSVTGAFLIGEASASKLASITLRTNFGKYTHEHTVVSLAPELSETHVQVSLPELRTSGVGTLRLRIGDAAATDPGFGTLDAVVLHVEEAEGR